MAEETMKSCNCLGRSAVLQQSWNYLKPGIMLPLQCVAVNWICCKLSADGAKSTGIQIICVIVMVSLSYNTGLMCGRLAVQCSAEKQYTNALLRSPAH